VRRLVLFGLLALALAAPAAASERHPTLAELEHEVMCPTCHQLLELSDAPVADRIRAFIEVRIRAGDTKSQIERRLVDQFGEGVLASPPTHGFDLLAWVLPIGGIGVGAVGLGALAWAWTRRRDPGEPAPDPGPALDPELDRRLDEALARFED